MQDRIAAARAELQAVRARIAAAKQSKRMTELVTKQIQNEPNEGDIWQGAGRMFFKTSRNDYKKECETKQKELDKQLSSLSKKELYFNTTLEKMVQAFQSQ